MYKNKKTKINSLMYTGNHNLKRNKKTTIICTQVVRWLKPAKNIFSLSLWTTRVYWLNLGVMFRQRLQVAQGTSIYNTCISQVLFQHNQYLSIFITVIRTWLLKHTHTRKESFFLLWQMHTRGIFRYGFPLVSQPERTPHTHNGHLLCLENLEGQI